jgi:hypothetical protein
MSSCVSSGRMSDVCPSPDWPDPKVVLADESTHDQILCGPTKGLAGRARAAFGNTSELAADSPHTFSDARGFGRDVFACRGDCAVPCDGIDKKFEGAIFGRLPSAPLDVARL